MLFSYCCSASSNFFKIELRLYYNSSCEFFFIMPFSRFQGVIDLSPLVYSSRSILLVLPTERIAVLNISTENDCPGYAVCMFSIQFQLWVTTCTNACCVVFKLRLYISSQYSPVIRWCAYSVLVVFRQRFVVYWLSTWWALNYHFY